MESGPSKISEAMARCLVPPACREEVLGDMRERHQRLAPYLLEAAQVIPCVIYSRICRTTDAMVGLMEALSMYTTFVIAAWSLDRALLSDERGFVRLAIPTAICLVATILGDAYSNPQKRWPLKPIAAPTLGFAFASIVQCMLKRWALPLPVFAWGSAVSLLLVATLRLIFPPVTDRPQAANIPAHWQKLELLLFSLDLRSILLSCGVLLAVILYLLGK
jgi:hypothetical protein